MIEFECVGCGVRLSVPVSSGVLADDAATQDAMPAGTYAIDDGPFGPPYVEVDGRRVRHTVHVSDGPRGAFVLAPGDVCGATVVRDARRRQGNCGPDRMNGPNLARAGCGCEVAAEATDCWTWQDVRLYPFAVRVVPVVEQP